MAIRHIVRIISRSRKASDNMWYNSKAARQSHHMCPGPSLNKQTVKATITRLLTQPHACKSELVQIQTFEHKLHGKQWARTKHYTTAQNQSVWANMWCFSISTRFLQICTFEFGWPKYTHKCVYIYIYIYVITVYMHVYYIYIYACTYIYIILSHIYIYM